MAHCKPFIISLRLCTSAATCPCEWVVTIETRAFLNMCSKMNLSFELQQTLQSDQSDSRIQLHCGISIFYSDETLLPLQKIFLFHPTCFDMQMIMTHDRIWRFSDLPLNKIPTLGLVYSAANLRDFAAISGNFLDPFCYLIKNFKKRA